MPAIDITDLTVSFPDGTVGLSGINLTVQPEEFLALIGPSGSGKTTLLRSIAGFLVPDSGHLTIDGTDMTRVAPENRRLGMVFQQHAVWPHMSVAGNVAYPLKRAGVGRVERQQRVERALELVGLAGYALRRPASLSGGQQQRVALARAIVAEPRVLLLDEALSALDEPLRDSLRRELVALTRREGLTAVHVTHDRSEALSIADRVVVLDQGRIQQIAEPAELISRPASARVAAFIADAAVIPAELTTRGVHCAELGATWALEDVELVGDSTPAPGAVQLAVLPAAVEVTSRDAPGSLPAQISSVLFAGADFSLTLGTESGHRFRANLSGPRPRVGDQVGMRVHRPLCYVGQDTVSISASTILR